MVITFTIVVSLSLMFTGAMVAVVEIRDPEADTSNAVDVLFTSITIILGALLGLLAGKSEGVQQLGERPDKTRDDITGTGPPQ
jgi:hypothetical protein